MKTLLTTSALALGMAVSAPALAQDSAASSTASPATSAPSTAAEPAPMGGADTMGTTSSASPATPTASNNAAQISAVVEASFPKYDADGSGELSEAEFKQWVADLKTQEMAASGQGLDPAQADQYASRALQVADADGNKAVTRDELTTFLGGG